MAEWAVFQGRMIVPFPVTQLPMAAEITVNPMVQSVTSGYSGQLSLTCWPSKGYITLDLTFPPMVETDAVQFVDFFAACEGQQAVFNLPSPIAAVIPAGTGTSGYYQLTSNLNKYSVNVGFIYGVNFSIREVLSSA
jgi:hypothetical protein